MKFEAPVKGDTRVKRGFLLFSLSIGGEGRWLEFARWEEKYVPDWQDRLEWRTQRWIDKEEVIRWRILRHQSAIQKLKLKLLDAIGDF